MNWPFKKQFTFTIMGKIKSKSNFKPQQRWRYAEHLKWEKAQSVICMLKMPKGFQPKRDGGVVVTYYFKSQVHCDVSNPLKDIIDITDKAGCWLVNDRKVLAHINPIVYGEEEKTEVEVWT